MEKVQYDKFPEKIEVLKEGDLFVLYCAGCGIDLMQTTGRKPYVGTEKLMRDVATLHNRDTHWSSLGGNKDGTIK